jgi:hypothetical protein
VRPVSSLSPTNTAVSTRRNVLCGSYGVGEWVSGGEIEDPTGSRKSFPHLVASDSLDTWSDAMAITWSFDNELCELYGVEGGHHDSCPSYDLKAIPSTLDFSRAQPPRSSRSIFFPPFMHSPQPHQNRSFVSDLHLVYFLTFHPAFFSAFSTSFGETANR